MAVNRPQPSITCDTAGCPSTLTGAGLMSYRKEWEIAAGHGWRHDPTKLRRCPACVTKGWPWCMPCDGAIPDPSLYNNPVTLKAWCDATYGPPGDTDSFTVTVWSGDTTDTGKIQKVVKI
jgi:hypothetical protein